MEHVGHNTEFNARCGSLLPRKAVFLKLRENIAFVSQCAVGPAIFYIGLGAAVLGIVVIELGLLSAMSKKR